MDSSDLQSLALIAAAIVQCGYGVAAYRLAKKHDVKLEDHETRIVKLEPVKQGQ